MELSRHWRLNSQRYCLIGERCKSGHNIFPPRDICPECSPQNREFYREERVNQSDKIPFNVAVCEGVQSGNNGKYPELIATSIRLKK